MNNTDNTISVNIEELKDKLDALEEDGYVTAELSIELDGYMTKVLRIQTLRVEDDSKIDYGEIEEEVASSMVW